MIDNLSDEDRLAMVEFDDQVDATFGATLDRPALHAIVDRLAPRGSTDIFDGLLPVRRGYRQPPLSPSTAIHACRWPARRAASIQYSYPCFGSLLDARRDPRGHRSHHDEPTLLSWLTLAGTRGVDEVTAAIQASRAS
jgi:hypothetical protein